MLQVLRMLVGLSIFSGHWAEPYVGQLWPQGQIAIDIFFMIEGFLAMGYLSQPAVVDAVRWQVIGRRIVHIYPIYAMALVIGFGSCAPFAFANADGWTVKSWIGALFSGFALLPFFSTLVHGSVFPLNPPSWAIVLELFGFALLVGLRVHDAPRRLFVLWIGAALTYLVLGAIWRDPNAGWSSTHYWGGWPRMTMGFAGGALLWHLYGRYGARAPKIHPVCVLVLFASMHLPKIHFIGWPLLVIGVPLLVWSAASCSQPVWLKAVAVFAERNTLAIYLLGYPIMMIWRFADTIFMASPAFAGSLTGFVLVLCSLLAASMTVAHLQKNIENLRYCRV
ncbi:acyltransferase family protein [Acetobacter estunensis]|uniref:acyltransferase family protein n=1 Tax=Acetobacter estunensis TaxID=104097 RepID=UPI001C2DAEEE|nr:acyltransferase family protein [Acetobacter estunensis]MBV1837109.1 acyltransferase family protein [Acetobacter estunensis]